MAMTRRPTIAQLNVFAQQILTLARLPPPAAPSNAIAALLTSSASFLSSLMPPRLKSYHHSHHYHAYPSAITDLPSFSALSQCFHRYSRADQWQAAAESGLASDRVRAFATFTSTMMEDLESTVRTVTHELRDLMEHLPNNERVDTNSLYHYTLNSNANTRARLQTEINALLDSSYAVLIEMRIHSSHYLFGHEVYKTMLDSDGSESVEMIALSHPIARPVNLIQLCFECAETARAAAIEKFGDAPEIVVKHHSASSSNDVDGDSQRISDVTMLGCASHIHFILLELLKNSIKSTIHRYGVLQLHAAQPIEILVSDSKSSNGKHVGLIVSDSGVGLSSLNSAHRQSPTPAALFDYFVTTSARPNESNDWRYSRSFGSPFSGLGVGLNMSKLYCETVYGGGLSVSWVPDRTQACVVLDSAGSAPIGRELLLLDPTHTASGSTIRR